jgi:hypothetical protein
VPVDPATNRESEDLEQGNGDAVAIASNASMAGPKAGSRGSRPTARSLARERLVYTRRRAMCGERRQLRFPTHAAEIRRPLTPAYHGRNATRRRDARPAGCNRRARASASCRARISRPPPRHARRLSRCGALGAAVEQAWLQERRRQPRVTLAQRGDDGVSRSRRQVEPHGELGAGVASTHIVMDASASSSN